MAVTSVVFAVLVVLGVACTAVGVAFRRDPARFVAFEAATLGGEFQEGPAERAGWIHTAGGLLIAVGLASLAAAVAWTVA
jgi:hypothetical protein